MSTQSPTDRFLRIYAFATTTILLVAGLSAFARPSQQEQIIRARGLVIVDAAGRERILIGAPVPDARNRLRTNLVRAESAWAKNYPSGTLMKYYPTYRNAVSGMLVLDERGVDRVVVGDSLPDPNIGRRIGSDVGMLINDARGFERSGYGLLTVRGRDRMVLGLDTDEGTEGVALAVIDSGRRGIFVNARDLFGFFGSAPGRDSVDGTGAAISGLMLKRGAAIRHFTP